jgi:hypothetical protein
MDKRKRTKGQTKIYKTLHKKLKIEQHESHLSSGMNLGTPEGKDVPAPHVGRNYCNTHQHESSRCHKKMMAGEIFPVIKTHISYFNRTCVRSFYNYLAFQPCDFERTRWSFFQKRVVRTNFDIYVCIVSDPNFYIVNNKFNLINIEHIWWQ